MVISVALFLQIRIYSREEVLDQVGYALEVTNQTMMYFEKFFGVPYSLSKSGTYTWSQIRDIKDNKANTIYIEMMKASNLCQQSKTEDKY